MENRVKPEYRHICRDAEGLVIGEALVYRNLPDAQLGEIVRELGERAVVRPYDDDRTEVFLRAVWSEPERAWLVEDGRSSPASPLYLTGMFGKPDCFNADVNEAIRFSRETDARDAAVMLGMNSYRIAEHQWG